MSRCSLGISMQSWQRLPMSLLNWICTYTPVLFLEIPGLCSLLVVTQD
ncbi:hypothetical protein COLO4_25088 [Corchorus olitorius]|uniref:Uncharacterized protein n=1 Tax=Corchorus olitorius TaxID=93759 RepID=A0A1R3I4R9_9ROSI|nr:hypothetical protein COLO4_25088 [Corchorus olitorius]